MSIHAREPITNSNAIGTSSLLARQIHQGLKKAFLFALTISILLVGQSVTFTQIASAADDPGYLSKINNEPFGYQWDTWGFAARNCTSYVAYRISLTGLTYHGQTFKDAWGVGTNGRTKWDDAQYWDDYAQGIGFKVDNIPSIGAIAQWNANQSTQGVSSGSVGHVAYVTAVAGDSSVTIQDYNRFSDGQFNTTSGVKAGRYIHLERSLPGGWWQGPTPDPTSAQLNNGQTIGISAYLQDNNNGGLRSGNITVFNPSVDGSWHTLNSGNNSISGSSAPIYATYPIPAGTNYFRISFDVYSNTASTNPTVFQLSPMGVRQYCVTGSTICPSQTAYDPYDDVTVNGGLGGGSGSSDPCTPGPNQATVFIDAGFGGQCEILSSGYYPNPSYISLQNDSISSVKIGSGAQLELCRDDNYSNTCEWFGSDNSDLANTSIGTNQASSAQVQSPDMPTCTPGVNQVSFFVDDHFKGQCVTKDGGVYNDMNAIGTIPNDSVSSVKVGAGVKLEMCQDNNLSNTCQLLDSGDFDFGGLAIGNDQMSSAAVIANGSQPNLPSPPCVYDTSRSGVLLYQGLNYTGSCVFLTSDINDLTSTQFAGAQSVRVLGAYLNYFQLVGYSDTNFGTQCGDFISDQLDLGACDGSVKSLKVLAYTPIQLANNIAQFAHRDQPNTGVVVDNDLSTEWDGGHQVPISFVYDSPQMMQEIVVFDRLQSSTDNNQANSIQLTFSDGTQIKYINMNSGGPRCADIRFPAKSVAWVTVEPYDASGNNGFREVQIWDNSGTVHSSITCPNIWQGTFVPKSDGATPIFQNVAPVVADQWNTTQETQTNQVLVSVSQAGSLPVTLSASNLPAFATFTDNGNSTGTVNLAPQIGQAGSYDITISATNGMTSGSGTVHVAITPAPTPPTAALSVTPSTGTSPVTVTADASGSAAGSNAIVGYTFDFGDGTIIGPQAGSLATHVYTAPGTFSVKVTATDSIGLSSSHSQNVVVNAAPPTAGLSLSASSGVAPVNITANAATSTPGSNPIASYTFDFGDGTTVGPQAMASAAHAYTIPGSYSVKVTVADSIGLTNSTTKSITVNPAPPTASFSMTPTSGVAPVSVSVNASASTAGSNPIAQYTFNFGDGIVVGPQAGSTSSHIYTNGGTYTVTVTVKDSIGLTTSTTKSITIAAAPTVFEDFQSGLGNWTISGNVATTTSGSNTFLRFALKVNKASTAARTIGSPALSQYSKITLKINLNGSTLPAGTGSQFYLKQGTNTYSVSLSSYVTQGLSGWQTISIPLSDFGGFNKASTVNSLGFSMLSSKAITVDVDDITFAN